MRLITCNDADDAGRRAADSAAESIRRKPSLLFCAASGQSTASLYAALAARRDRFPVEELRVIQLDEWGGLTADDSRSCAFYIRERLLHPLGIPPDRFCGFHSVAAPPERECERISACLTQSGPIDLCVLGLGRNGHLALNEPGDYLRPFCHVASLTAASTEHAMLKGGATKPTHGLTLGMADILSARKILMMVTGAGKEDAKREFLSGLISTRLPASFLWLHPDVECYIG
jgi:galactosamine-6-phosphate isomerase